MFKNPKWKGRLIIAFIILSISALLVLNLYESFMDAPVNNGYLTREQFSQKVLFKDAAQVVSEVGRPERRSGSAGNAMEFWDYDNKTFDPLTNKIDASLSVFFMNGIVNDVKFYPSPY